MSIVFAFANKTCGCIATDSQRTNLQTGEVEHDAIKSRRIAENIAVGYAGHGEPCEIIAEDALKSFNSSCGTNKLAWKFALSIEAELKKFNSTYYNSAGGNFFLNFLTVGPNGDGTMMILLYGTVTGFKLLSPVQSELPVQFSFISPDDVDKETCAKIAIESIMEAAPDYSLEKIADKAVQQVSVLSKWCGGKTQILTVDSHPRR